ncbi:MAG: tRNA (adenosine(37)-N6)-dimethylallyltransferase MiaA [Candidatus Binataceae bacterium]
MKPPDMDAPPQPFATSAPRRQSRVGFIVGPTGVGKSAFALDLADRLGAEVVNADSRQVYRGMDIGTAKPTPAERHRVPHHLIDIRSPDEPLDAATFASLAHAAIAEIAARRRSALVVGGSGLYLRVLRDGIFDGPAASPALRGELYASGRDHGVPYLHAQLREADPASAAWISPNDRTRIVRALEVFRLTGMTISEHHRRHNFARREYESLTVGLEMERGRLYDTINRRFEAMVADGMVEETRRLMAAGLAVDRAPLSTIGYRQIAAFIRGELDLKRAIELAQRDSRRFAKRQLTWFRRDPDVVWLDAGRGIEQALAWFNDFFSSGSTTADG